MPRTCPVTNKKYQRTIRRSHSMQATIDQRKPNFVIKKVGNKRVKVTAAGLKLLKKKRISLEKALASKV